MISDRDLAVRTRRKTAPPAIEDVAARNRFSVVMSTPERSAARQTAPSSSRPTGTSGSAQRLDAPPEIKKSVQAASVGSSRKRTRRRPASRLRPLGTGWSPTMTSSVTTPSLAVSSSVITRCRSMRAPIRSRTHPTIDKEALPIATTSTAPPPWRRSASASWRSTSDAMSSSLIQWLLIASASRSNLSAIVTRVRR